MAVDADRDDERRDWSWEVQRSGSTELGLRAVAVGCAARCVGVRVRWSVCGASVRCETWRDGGFSTREKRDSASTCERDGSERFKQ